MLERPVLYLYILKKASFQSFLVTLIESKKSFQPQESTEDFKGSGAGFSKKVQDANKTSEIKAQEAS